MKSKNLDAVAIADGAYACEPEPTQATHARAATRTTHKATQPKATPRTASGAATKASRETVAAPSKKAQVIRLISRAKGASLAEIMKVTGWQRHTVRGFLLTLKARGAKLESFTTAAGARTYRAS